ncbi:hypothetical protein [Carboxylicivirga sp. N1Y90]|uniref:hypothetical protein n=1 Tax=Carboxylicivirga fragile TaxID=3417571 RepID=UPI003D331169|nr:hypothetical protein [Marinilabiliaceae bacterium N1Y90]
MSKKQIIKPLLVILVATIGLYSCEDDPEEYCEEYPICDLSPTYCCDDDGNCTYSYDGNSYSSLEDLTSAICPASITGPELEALQIELDKLSIRLISEARSAAICK